MSKRNFRELLEARWKEGKVVCVGLDSELNKIPGHVFQGTMSPAIVIPRFNRRIIETTKDLVCAYKPNIAFYEAHGQDGLAALDATITHIHELAPDVPVILDAKRADIDNTNNGYVEMAFNHLEVDAITVHPYLGGEALKPFLNREDKGIFVLCRTSNKGANEFQDLRVPHHGTFGVTGKEYHHGTAYVELYKYVAHQVATEWNINSNCGLVVGATYPKELAEVRKLIGTMPILIPGIGAQGGDVEATVKAGVDSRGMGMIINSSRGIIFASDGEDFAEVARQKTQELHMLINQFRTEAG